MIKTISKQGGRRYPQFGSSPSTDAMPLRFVGTSSTGAFTVKFRKTLSQLSGKIGQRQVQDR